ncbi:Mbov_0400 family ICE element protein [Mycoplasmopsis cynos]|uniref:Uncharacterized protein n=1 Tax=Mycoplasmopsis cynos (strain C142) TaxID=1246955 RepID=L0RXN5_MYCC1|nr:hypothetical protein [Mycoplasmopsis cynos]WQQ14568.1 hypothetical protein RRG42_03090 [Mycoplasmopsis cynos]CCP24351.1 Putative uncharacterized protein [Mycoplasmopsis cynos C142]
MITDKNDLKMKMIMDEYESIIFDRFEQKISAHPIIIFTDYLDNYYYIKARSKYNDNGKIKKPFDGEITIKEYEKGLPSKDSYVDLTQIFQIEKETFYKYFKGNKIFLSTEHLKLTDIKKIYDNLARNLKQEPPYITFSYVYENEKGKLNSYVAYSEKNLLINEGKRKHHQNADSFINAVLEKRSKDKRTLSKIENVYLSLKDYYDEIIYENEENKQSNSNAYTI